MILALLIIFQTAMAYNPENIRLHERSYYQYLRPQVRSILMDYDRLLQELNPDLKEIQGFMAAVNQIHKLLLENILSQSEIDEVLRELPVKIEKSQLKGLGEIPQQIKHLQGKTIRTPLELKNLYNKLNLLMVENLRRDYQKSFNLLWLEFIMPLQREILYRDNRQFLEKQLTKLNNAWNIFNVHMTKRNHKLEDKVETRIEIMHRRWRSILKLTVVP